MKNILIVYSTTDGHTIKICHELQSVIEKSSHKVSLLSITDDSNLDLTEFDNIVVGASIRYGKHNKNVSHFVQKNKAILNTKTTAFFSVNVVARKPDKNHPDTNPYLRKFLDSEQWEPSEVAVFAGKIDYQKYRFIDRQMIRFIMYITKGPTDVNAVYEFTNWDKVREFGTIISEM